jgi:cysteine desulfurases, SufS subfamily
LEAGFDVAAVRQQLPLLRERMHGKPLAYLDNAATTPKPLKVIETVAEFYSRYCANVHRGVYELSQRATVAYEEARRTVSRFLGAESQREIIFVKGTTEAINLVAQTYGRSRVASGDEVLVSQMEHHSNIVPWQILCQEKGATLKVIPVTEKGEIELGEYQKRLSVRTKIVAITHASNVLGTINPVADMARMAHDVGACVLVDGAQAAAHLRVDVTELGCDFYAFSGHKVFGPTGIGVLYGREELLEQMPPYQAGGDMIRQVSFEKTTYNSVPYKFEAGTPNIAGALGLAAALEYLDGIGRAQALRHEQSLLTEATAALEEIRGLRILGTAEHKVSVISFVLDEIHPHDLGTILDLEGIAIRAGHHCAQPLMERYGVPASARASLAFYNTAEEIQRLAAAIDKAKRIFK